VAEPVRNVRIELFVPAGATPGEDSLFQNGIGYEARPCSGGSIIALTSPDSPFLRQTLIEFLAARPGSAITVVPCNINDNPYKTAHAVVAAAFREGVDYALSYNMKEAAKRLGVSYSYMKRLVRLGRIRRENGRVAAKELERYIGRKRVQAPSL
jgi:hypothetical protein